MYSISFFSVFEFIFNVTSNVFQTMRYHEIPFCNVTLFELLSKDVLILLCMDCLLLYVTAIDNRENTLIMLY